MKGMKAILIAVAAASIAGGSAFGQGAPGADEALAIIRAIDAKQASGTSRQEMTMITYPDSGDEGNKREFTIKSYSRGADDSYMEFLEPKSIRGLRILGKGADNWVYFPSTGRTRKIAGKSRKDSVQGVGGDFSYEDMGGGTFEEKYGFRLVLSDASSWTLEGTAKKADGAYSKIVMKADKATNLPLKIEYYGAEEGLFKELTLAEVKTMGGRQAPTRMTMINLKKKTRTVVIMRAAEYDAKIDDRFFNPSLFDK